MSYRVNFMSDKAREAVEWSVFSAEAQQMTCLQARQQLLIRYGKDIDNEIKEFIRKGDENKNQSSLPSPADHS